MTGDLREALEAEVDHLTWQRDQIDRRIGQVRSILRFDDEERSVPRERALVLWVGAQEEQSKP